MLTLAAVLVSAWNSAVAADFPYDKFERGTAAAITGQWAAGLAPGPLAKTGSEVIIENLQRNVVRLVYRGDHRAIDAATATFLIHFQKSIPAAGDFAGQYTEEYRFSEDGSDYWLPVQSSVATFFHKEMKPGDPVDLYVIAAGGVLESDRWKWVLAVEEFDIVK